MVTYEVYLEAFEALKLNPGDKDLQRIVWDYERQVSPLIEEYEDIFRESLSPEEREARTFPVQ